MGQLRDSVSVMFRTGSFGRWWVLWIALAGTAWGAELHGHVRDEQDAPIAGAKITVRAATLSGSWQAQSDATGAFSIQLPADGDYLLNVERQGYYEIKDRPVHVEGSQEATLTLGEVREVFQSVNVNEQPSPVNIEQTQREQRLTGTEINDLFYPNSHSLRNAVKLMPEVVEDVTGAFHFEGSSENQVEYLLNGFNISNPISGNFGTTLPVEGIRSMDYLSGRFSPEYGKGSAGVLNINTQDGTDLFRFTTTDFIPGVDIQQGVRLGNWYPRFGVSGPIAKGHAWFADTFGVEYNNSFVPGLPSGQNTRSGFAGDNVLHTQWTVTPRNILFADFLLNVDHENRIGLGPLDPLSTTRTIRSSEYFGSLKDELYTGRQSLIELGYAHNVFLASQTPQGQSLYIFTPEGRTGNYFVNGRQTASRDQWMAHGYTPPFHFLGSHQVQVGGGADALTYDGNFHRTGYELQGLDGQTLSVTTFTGSGVFGVHDTQQSAWVLDTWRIAKRLEIDAGLREDWDHRVAATAWSPRLSFSWAPFASGRTRVSGGYNVTHDAVPLDPLGRVLDQAAVTTPYSNGMPSGSPVLTELTRGPLDLKLPRATNWSLGVDHQVSSRIYASVKYLRRRGTEGFTFLNVLNPDAAPSILPLPNGSAAGLYELANLRRDDYDSVQFSVHQSLSGQHEWMVSYTWSRAQSNALLDINTSQPLQVLGSLVPVPWDSPHRLLAWAYLPVPFRWGKTWSVAVTADARSGFPFSVQDQNGMIVGGVDSHRYPFDLDLNLAIEKMVTLLGYRFALRGGMNNLTNARNPTAVNNTLGSPQFLQFYGLEGRHFVVRIRFFGRAGKSK